MVTVPVVNVNYVDVEGYFMTYTIDDEYQNFKWKLKMKDNQKIYDLRKKLQDVYGWPMSNMIFCHVHDKQVIRIIDCSMTIKEFQG